MSPVLEQNLTLILFLPWLLVLCWAYAAFPRVPKGRGRRIYDTLALALALAAFFVSMQWSFLHADPAQASIWKQILATAVSYGVFLIMLGAAVAIRSYWFARRKIIEPASSDK